MVLGTSPGADTGAVHQDQLIDQLRGGGGQDNRDRSPARVADEAGPLDPELRQEVPDERGVVGRAPGAGRAVAGAEAGQVGRERAVLGLQTALDGRDRRAARPPAVEDDDRRAGPLDPALAIRDPQAVDDPSGE
jgi:hypothetical protein